MIARNALLVRLLALVDQVPLPSEYQQPRRGRPYLYSTRLIIKLWLVMIFRRIRSAYTLHRFLQQDQPEAQELREALFGDGPIPSRRTIERRLTTLPAALEAEIASLGQLLVHRIQVWSREAAAAAIDSAPFHARGGVWHKRHRERGEVPDSRIDTEAGWTKSGWHGWVYGWKLHVVVTATRILIPLAAMATPADVGDNTVAPRLIRRLPHGLRWLLGDTAYQDAKLHQLCQERQIQLVAPRRGGPRPRRDPGAAVRRVLHTVRNTTIERFFAHFKNVFELLDQVPTRGRIRTSLLLLGSVYVYQLVLLLQLELGQQPLRDFKALLRMI